MICEDPYLANGFLHNLCPCFDMVFPVLGVITRTRDKFVEMSITYLESQESKKQLFQICLGRLSIKKEKRSLNLIYNIISLSKIAGKPESFSGNIS